MKVLYLSYPLELSEDYPDTAVSMGYFDGVHIGHQKVLETGIQLAKNKKLASAVMTFHPHPKKVLGKGDYSRCLTPLEDKLNLFQSMGVDIVYVVQFNQELSMVHPVDFIEHFLVPLNIKHAIVGFDYKFGSKGMGDAEYLKEKSLGRYEVITVPPFMRYKEKVGSTVVREYLSNGNISRVNELLGRHYYIEAVIEKENHKTKGAVMSIHVPKDYLLPVAGSYQVIVYIGDDIYKGSLTIEKTQNYDVKMKSLILQITNNHQLEMEHENISIEFLSINKEPYKNVFWNKNRLVL